MGATIASVRDTWPSIGDVVETLTLRAGYNTNLVIAGTTLLGLAAGIVGVFALLRKRSLMADALSHATLPGIVLAFLVAGWLGHEGRSLAVLLLGAAVSGVLGVVCVQLILRHTRLREDAAIGIVLSVFFGAGVVGLSYVQANAAAGSAGLQGFIYGQAATMRASDVYLMSGIAIVVVAASVLLLKEFSLVCFNDAFAKVDGWPVSLVDLIMMALVVAVTVAGLQAVGIILVVAMLIVPAVSARFWTERLWLLVVIAGLIGASSGYLGSVMSALLPRKPAGAVIVLSAGVIFVLSMLVAPSRGVVALCVRRLRLRVRIAGDHLLERAYGTDSADFTRDDLLEFTTRRGWSSAFRHLVLFSLRRVGMLDLRASHKLAVSEAGLARGARVSRNHALWEQYLISYADIAPNHVDWSVDQVEHVLSDELIAELEFSLGVSGSIVPDPDRGSA